jgi:GTP cyclohydrolase IA
MSHPLRKDRAAPASVEAHTPTLCNQTSVMPLNAATRALMKAAAAQKIGELFDILGIDYRNDHNTRETPSRVAKMYVEELLKGRYAEPPAITEFDNVANCDQLIVTGPIELRSMCAHHMMPIYGSAFIGVLPAADGKIIGLSKYDRIVHHFGARLQIQEELVRQIGAFIMEKTGPRGLAVRVSAVHMCKTHRGVHASHASRMVNTEFYGDMLTDKTLRTEFMQECMTIERAGR